MKQSRHEKITGVYGIDVDSTKNKFVLNTWSLVFIYGLLCVITMAFSDRIFPVSLEDGRGFSPVPGAVLLVIPAILIVYLVYNLWRLVNDLVKHKAGGKIQMRLAGYFAIVTVLAAAPVLLLAVNSINRVRVYWKTMDTTQALADAEAMIGENYALKLNAFSLLVARNAVPRNDVALLAKQDFQTAKGGTKNAEGGDKSAEGTDIWTNVSMLGDDAAVIAVPPPARSGFADRMMPRDVDIIRYVDMRGANEMTVYSFDLGKGFDATIQRVQAERNRFDLIGKLEPNILRSLFMFVLVFLVPTLIMTIVISLTFSQETMRPIVDIAQATRRVAAGDFSIHIISNKRDEMGLLVQSFNTMVENLQRSRDALVKAEKTSIWQELAQQLAHEIKNPLTPIKLSAERVLRRWKTEPERTGEIIESSMLAIIQEVESLSGLLSEFRTLSKPIEPTENLYNLKDAVTEATAVFAQSYPGVIIDLTGLPAGIIVRVDKKHIGQIVMNLVSNAIDAINMDEGSAPEGDSNLPPNGGAAALANSDAPIKGAGALIGNRGVPVGGEAATIGDRGAPIGKIEVRGDIIKKRDAVFCRLSFKDNGKGVAKDVAEKIWTPYFTTKESGTGLGLAIVERIVQDYGGAVQLNSAPGAGATFLVDLPMEGAA